MTFIVEMLRGKSKQKKGWRKRNGRKYNTRKNILRLIHHRRQHHQIRFYIKIRMDIPNGNKCENVVVFVCVYVYICNCACVRENL